MIFKSCRNGSYYRRLFLFFVLVWDLFLVGNRSERLRPFFCVKGRKNFLQKKDHHAFSQSIVVFQMASWTILTLFFL